MTTSTVLAIRDDQVVFDEWQTKALAHIGVETASKADLAVFFHTCKRTGLDPFARQIYMIRRDGKQTMQAGIDGLRLIAQRTVERTDGTIGYEDTQWCGTDGQWADVWLSSEPPAAARVTVIRDGQRFPAIALWSEYVQTKRDGNITAMWKNRPAGQLAKCAEALALRKAFPQDLSGVYATDEMGHRDAAPLPEQPRVSTADFAQAGPTGPVDVSDAEIVEEATEWPAAPDPADPADDTLPMGGE